MSDLISRQAVLTLFEKRFLELQIAKRLPENKVQEYEQSGVNWCINTVRDIPSVENKGEWIRFKSVENGYYHIKCSKCGQYWSIDDHAKIFKYCFNCGADMRK